MRISTLFGDLKAKRRLERRKGGGGGRGGGGRGGGGRGGGGGGGSSGGGSGGSGGSGRGSTGGSGSGGSSGGVGGSGGGGGRSVPLGGSGAGGRGTATAGGFGGGPRTTIPGGQPFAGRTQGGGTRNDVYGSSAYGSGYPAGYPGAIAGRGVAGRGFPFFFWPVVWGGAAGAGAGAYLHSNEYGNANNSSRPGGQLVQAPFQSKSQNTTLHIIADRATTTSLIESITSACSQNLNTTAISASQFDPNTTNAVKPEQAIQYYRASSVVLTLDGYNNTAALDGDPNAPPVPLPGWVDRGLLDCVNSTIGAEVPLVDGSSSSGAPVGMGGVDMHGVVAVVLCLLAVLQVV